VAEYKGQLQRQFERVAAGKTDMVGETK